MPKYTLKPRNHLKQIKEMLTVAEWSPDHVLEDWLSNYWKQEVPVRPWTVEENLRMFQTMFIHAGGDVEYFLKDWKKNYRKKRKHKIVEIYTPEQKAIFKRINGFSDKAYGIGIKDYRSAI